MRSIRHDNLNSVIGACVDPGSVCILSEYCSRGSLLDILANDSIKLDNMFIASLILDLLRVILTTWSFFLSLFSLEYNYIR